MEADCIYLPSSEKRRKQKADQLFQDICKEDSYMLASNKNNTYILEEQKDKIKPK